MIELSNVSKSYGPNELFSELNLRLNSGNKIGLVGRNGSGKSTLLKLIQSTIENNIIDESWLYNTCEISFNADIQLKSYFAGTADSPLDNLDLNNEDVINQITEKLEISHPFL